MEHGVGMGVGLCRLRVRLISSAEDLDILELEGPVRLSALGCVACNTTACNFSFSLQGIQRDIHFSSLHVSFKSSVQWSEGTQLFSQDSPVSGLSPSHSTSNSSLADSPTILLTG